MQKYIFTNIFFPLQECFCSLSVCFSIPTKVCAKKKYFWYLDLCDVTEGTVTSCYRSLHEVSILALEPHVSAKNEKQWAVNRAKYSFLWFSVELIYFLNDSPTASPIQI